MALLRAARLIKAHRLNVLAAVALFTFIAVLYRLSAPPLYRYHATIYINPATMDAHTELDAEMAILTSASTIASAIPSGNAAAYVNMNEPLYAEHLLPLDMHPYLKSWLEIEHFDIYKHHYGKEIPITAISRGKLRMEAPKGANVTLHAKAHDFPPTTVFTLVPTDRESYIHHIKQQLDVRPASPKALNVMTVSFTHTHAGFAKAFLNKLVDSYIDASYHRQLAPIRRSMSILKQAAQNDGRRLFAKQQHLQHLRASQNAHEMNTTLDQLIDDKHQAELTIADLNEQFRLIKAAQPSDDSKLMEVQTNRLAALQQLDALYKQIDKLSGEYAKLKALEREVEQIRERYQNNLKAINDHHIRASSMLGYASVIDKPGAQAEYASTPVYYYALLGALVGLFIGWCRAALAQLMMSPVARRPRKPMPPYDNDDNQKVFV